MDNSQVLLVSILHVFHLVILHTLWDDDSSCYSKPECCWNNIEFLLRDVEPLLRFCCSQNSKFFTQHITDDQQFYLISINLISSFFVLQRIPVWWRWYYYICPVSWTLYGLVASQFGGLTDELEENLTLGQFVKSYFGFESDFVPYVAIIIIAFCILFAFIFAFSVKAFNFQRK